MTLKEILNSLRCPLCESQVDGIYSYSPRFYCATEKDHYNVWFKDNLIKKETINLYDYNKLIKYEIIKIYDGDNITTKVVMENIDAEGREIFTFEDRSFTIGMSLFDFRNFNLDTALNKIKTILLFK
jgi:hypothetical protein